MAAATGEGRLAPERADRRTCRGLRWSRRDAARGRTRPKLRLHRVVHPGIESSFQMHFIKAAVGEIEPGRNRVCQRMGPDLRLARLRLPGMRVRAGIIESRMVEILVEDVKLPKMLVGIGDPEFRLQRIAALDPLLALRGDASFLKPARCSASATCSGETESRGDSTCGPFSGPGLASRSTRAAAFRSQSLPEVDVASTGSLFSSS